MEDLTNIHLQQLTPGKTMYYLCSQSASTESDEPLVMLMRGNSSHGHLESLVLVGVADRLIVS